MGLAACDIFEFLGQKDLKEVPEVITSIFLT